MYIIVYNCSVVKKIIFEDDGFGRIANKTDYKHKINYWSPISIGFTQYPYVVWALRNTVVKRLIGTFGGVSRKTPDSTKKVVNKLNCTKKMLIQRKKITQQFLN